MKKKILGLLLALCLVVALLPVTAFAATAKITVTMNGLTWTDVAEGTHKYATTDAATGTATECLETDNWNVHLDYTAGQTPTLYLKNATLNAAKVTNGTETVVVPALKVATDGAFVLNSVEGTTNTLTSTVLSTYNAYPLYLLAKGGTIVTGTGKLIGNSAADNDGPATNHAAAAVGTPYNLTFKNADVEFMVKDASYHPCIAIAGSGDTEANMPGLLVIEGGNMVLTNPSSGRAIAYLPNAWAQGTSIVSAQTAKNVTIKNGANVKISGKGNASPVAAAGGVIVENATLEIDMNATNGQTGWTGAELPKFPQIIGKHTVEYRVANKGNVLKSFLSADTADADYIAPGTDMTAVESYLRYLKIYHTCTAGTDCTVAGTCADCGKVFEAKESHKFDGDCTTADACQNDGCTVKAEAKAAHAFDADCTTADKCANCDVMAKAGAHIFDNDCTTADKCTSCGAAATAEKAHKYADNKDTTCDNEGCKNVRKIEEAGKNPQTGDNTALVLCVVALLTSAIALVLTKKKIAL